MELKIAQKDIELHQLKERVHELEIQLNEETIKRTSQTEELSQQLVQEQQKSSRLQQELFQRPTIDECNSLKQQISILKVFLFFF